MIVKWENMKSQELDSIIVNQDMEKFRVEVDKMHSEMISDYKIKLHEIEHKVCSDTTKFQEAYHSTKAE